jgi:hypothetical protein
MEHLIKNLNKQFPNYTILFSSYGNTYNIRIYRKPVYKKSISIYDYSVSKRISTKVFISEIKEKIEDYEELFKKQ